MTELALEAITIEPEETAEATVIWLHGLGASGEDFVDAVPDLRLPKTTKIRFVFPHAPMRPVTLNAGFWMPAWFDIHGLTEEDPIDEEGLREGCYMIEQFITSERNKGIDSQKIILGGFSQGGALAMYCGLRSPEPLAGVFGLSTYIPDPDSLEYEANEANQSISMFIAHGTDDALLDLDRAKQGAEYLEEMGHPMIFEDYVMGHEVCSEELKSLGQWMTAVLK